MEQNTLNSNNIDAGNKIASFRVKQSMPYEFKVNYARIRAWEFYNECGKRDLDCYVSVGGLDSITLFFFLKSIGIDVPAVSVSELKAIDKMWDEEGDLTCRALVETYHKVKGKKLPWDDYKTPRFDDEAIQAIRDVADKYDIPVELITKLIVSVDTNKHITKNNKMQKAFDSIIGQGWLHYNSVEGALNHED